MNGLEHTQSGDERERESEYVLLLLLKPISIYTIPCASFCHPAIEITILPTKITKKNY